MKKLLLSLATVLLLASCGGESKVELLNMPAKPETTEVSGDLGDCYKVVEKEYKIIENSYGYPNIKIELERTDKDLPFEENIDILSYSSRRADGIAYYNVGFGIEFLDKDGNAVITQYPEDGEFEEQLVKLKQGEKRPLEFVVRLNDNERESFKNVVKFRISSGYQKVEGSNSSSGSSESTGSTDWDKVLDDYESMMNSYISAVKKSSQGDMSAMTEMANYLEKADSFASKLENAQDDMSSTQWARFLKIQEKMVKAASGL